MSFLLDTNHWSQLQRGHPRVLDRLKQLSPGAELFMPVIAQGELLAGVESLPDGKRKHELRRVYERTISEVAEILPVDSRVAECFASVYAGLRSAGKPIDTNDMWVAAIALAHNLTVVSNDSHLRLVPALRVEDWTV